MSVICALQNIKDKSAEVTICSDLTYLIDIINKRTHENFYLQNNLATELNKFSTPVCGRWIAKGSDMHILEVEQMAEQAAEAVKSLKC